MAKSKAWKSAIQFLVGILVSAGMLYWLAGSTRQNAEEFEWQDIAAIIRGIPFWVILLTLMCQLLQTWFRAVRYSLFLQQGDIRPEFKRLLAVTFARNMFVDLLPSRTGEVSYLILLKRLLGERMAKGIASMGASFAFDLVALLVLIVVVLGVSVMVGSGMSHQSLVIPLVLIVVLACYLFFYGYSQLMCVTRSLRTRLMTGGILFRLNRIAEETDTSITEIRRQRGLWKVFLLSMGIRVFKYAGMLLLLYFILDASFLAMEVGKLGSLFLGIVAGEASASMPIPTFMSFGTYEAGASFTLQSLGYSVQASVIAVFITHLISQSIDYSLGIGALWLSWVMGWFGKAKIAPQLNRRAIARVVMGVLFLLLSGVVALVLLSQRRSEKTSPIAQVPAHVVEAAIAEEATPMATDPVPSETSPRSLAGFVVWSSNRYGNHELVQLDLQSRELKRLTNTPEKEYYPGISPNGRRIVFARSHKAGWSFRNLSGWSIVLLDLETGEETIVAKEGYHPAWAGDDSHLIYSRNGKQILLMDLESGTERVIVEAGQHGVPAGYEFLTPGYNPEDGTVAVTIRGSRRTKYLFDRNGRLTVELPQGCQLAWVRPDYQQLIFTGSGTNHYNAFHLVNPDTGETQLLLDAPGEYSHEYFPRVSNDGKWLVFGASAEGHEHDTADYEIFLWRIGVGTNEIERLSNDPGNDSWPDIFVSP